MIRDGRSRGKWVWLGLWLSAALICALTVYVRTELIQPPEVAQLCDAVGATLWLQLAGASPICKVRAAFIVSYAWFGLGYAAMILTALTLLTRNGFVAWLALCVGAMGLVLYCFEPAAVSFAIGAVVLAGAQSRARANGSHRNAVGSPPRLF
ncbi:MAG: hypothetical protein M3O82_09590 [Verrucomicrobiota bacterium]|nr:hypothetical protein [Verrucomicrobiota bacterium]